MRTRNSFRDVLREGCMSTCARLLHRVNFILTLCVYHWYYGVFVLKRKPKFPHYALSRFLCMTSLVAFACAYEGCFSAIEFLSLLQFIQLLSF